MIRIPGILMTGAAGRNAGKMAFACSVVGRPMMVHACEQLRPHFREIHISANDWGKCAFLGLQVLPSEAAVPKNITTIANYEECRNVHDDTV